MRTRATSTPVSSSQLFPFCQLDFSFPLGPADGRYLARGAGDDLGVIVFKTLGAPQRRLLRGRRPKRARAGTADPAPVPTSRVSVIVASPFDDQAEAERWLDRCRRDRSERESAVEEALRVLNQAIHGHRLAASDPYVHEVTRAQAHQVRLGYGTGDEVVEGYWRVACTLPQPGRRSGRRAQMLSPQAELASILSGHRASYPSEDLLLRARLDLDSGRVRQAALQTRAARDALEAELEIDGGPAALKQELAWLREQRTPAAEVADAALRGDLGREQAEALRGLIERMERALRRRRYGGGD